MNVVSQITLHQHFLAQKENEIGLIFGSLILDYQLAFKIKGREYIWLVKKVESLNSPCTNESQ